MSLLTDPQLVSAVDYNAWAYEEVFKDSGLPWAFTVKYHGEMGTSSPSSYAPSHPNFAEATAKFQTDHGMVVDGKLGTRTLGMIHMVFPEEYTGRENHPYSGTTDQKLILLTGQAKSEIVQFTVKFEGGRAKNPYASMNKDAEWEGAFDRPKKDSKGKKIPAAERKNYPNFSPHRASKYAPGGFHIGLSWGAWQAAQEPGSLGDLLKLMFKLHPDLFKQVFGANWKELLDTTTARNRRTGKFSARTKAVGGDYLWKEPWLFHFKKAAEHEEFRETQRLWVADQYLAKALPVAEEYNLDSLGALAVLFDIAVQFGVGGMKKYVGKSKLRPGTPFFKNSIKKVIGVLPVSHQKRRNHILEEAGQDVRYTW